MKTQSKNVQNVGLHVGSSHHRQIRSISQCTGGEVQFSTLGSRNTWSGRTSSTRLGKSQQLCKLSILDDKGCVEKSETTELSCDNNCSTMGRPKLVSEFGKNVNNSSHKIEQYTRKLYENHPSSRTTEESKVENICLEDLWERKLSSLGWTETARIRMIRKWAPTTLNSYNKALQKLNIFCQNKGSCLTSINESVLAEYLCTLAARSDRPKSVSSTVTAALVCFCEAIGIQSMVSRNVNNLLEGLVKSQTVKPMKRSRVMPVYKFTELFLSWPGNYLMSLEDLRLKCITLLAITVMMRPSDAAPLSTVFDKKVMV